MSSAEIIRSEISHYLILADQLKALYQDIDDETLHDTLEGISELPDLIKGLIRSSLDDEALIGALKERVEDMQARLSRFKDRFERKRELASWAMTSAEIAKIQTEDFTLSLRQGPPRLEVSDQDKVPPEYLVPQPPKVDRSGLINALKRGDVIPGTVLVEGQMHVTVRVR
jgi:Siphovirus Gp157